MAGALLWYNLVFLAALLLSCNAARPALLTGPSASRQLRQAVAGPGASCGPDINAVCGSSQCCSKWGFCGTTDEHCLEARGCQSGYGRCSGGQEPANTTAPPPGDEPAPAGSNNAPVGGVASDSAAGVTKAQFTAVFAGDTDRCGQSCPGYAARPNTPEVIDKHWQHFKSAAAAQGFSLQNPNEASIFFGTIKHEYGGNLEAMAEFCGRSDASGASCPGGYGRFFGRGPLQLTWENNYRAMGALVGADLTANPDSVADPSSDLGWRAAMGFWAAPDFNCKGSWGDLAGLPSCPAAAAAGSLAGVTRRVNPLECAGGPYADKQPARVAAVEAVRSAWRLGPLAATSC